MNYLIYDMKEDEWWKGPEKETSKHINTAYLFDDKILDEKLAYIDSVDKCPKMIKIAIGYSITLKKAEEIAKEQRKIYLSNIKYLTKFDILDI